MAAKKRGTSKSKSRAKPKAKATSKRRTTTRRASSTTSGARAKRSSASASKRSARSRKVGNDFGIPARSTRDPEANRADQQRAAEEVRNVPAGNRNPDARQPRSSFEERGRDAGVGARDAGPGSASGGDLDPDIVGVGLDGTGLAEAGPDDPNSLGLAESDGTGNEFASGPPARRTQQPGRE